MKSSRSTIKIPAFFILLAVLSCIQAQSTVVITVRTIANCASYTSDRYCASCYSGYAPSYTRTECNRCATGCSACAGSISTCSSCFSGYSLVGNTCVSCPVGCSSCTSSSYCTRCNSGYYMPSDGRCSSCITGCSVCDNSFSCISCSIGFDKKNEGGNDICKMNAILAVVYFILIAICFCCIGVFVCIAVCRAISSRATYITEHRSSFGVQPTVHVEYDTGYNHQPMQPVVYDGGYQGGYNQGGYQHQEPMQPVVYDGNRY